MKRFLLVCLLSLVHLLLFSQVRPFKPLRYEEDYSYLASDTAGNWYKKMKYTRLSDHRQSYLSVGGEARYQYFYLKNEDWGEAPKDQDGFILARYLLHGDLHAGKHVRVFAQLQSSLVTGKPSTSPVEENELELHQAFVDYKGILANGSWFFRVGRQELSFGSQRLISVREMPNNRQSFDGLRSSWKDELTQLDLLFTNYVVANKGIFNDGPNRNTQLWGIYLVRSRMPVIHHIDLYYLGLKKKQALYDDGEGKELRHSAGTRIWSNKRPFQYDLEAVYQWGRFADKRVSAWTASANISYTFPEVALKPQIGLKAEQISGDKHSGDDRLNTFNPLFPRGAYFGLAALLGPSNLTDLHPYLEFTLADGLAWQTDYDIFWRHSVEDGIYGPNVMMIYSGAGSTARHIGQQLGTSLVYTPNQFLYLRAEFTWFNAGEYLKQAGQGKDIIMAGTTIQLKF